MEWRPVAGFPDYEIREDGVVRRLTPGIFGDRAGYIMRQQPSKKDQEFPYMQVTIRNPQKKRITRHIHVLVAISFIGSPPSPEHEVAHWDGVRCNNHFTNLRWATAKENTADRKRHGTIGGTHTNTVKLSWDQVRRIRESLVVQPGHQRVRRGSVSALANEFGVKPEAIMRARSAKTWKDYTKWA